MKTFSRKEDKIRGSLGDGICFLIVSEKVRLKLLANFSLHVFIERTWNEIKGNKEKKESLYSLLIEVCKEEKSILSSELQELILRIARDWLGMKEKNIEKFIKIEDYGLTHDSFLYLCIVLLGGGEIGKKFSTLILPRILKRLEARAGMTT